MAMKERYIYFSQILWALIFVVFQYTEGHVVEGKSNSANVPVVGNTELVRSRQKRGTSGSRLTYDERLEFLSVHNDFRKNVSPEAENMKFMVWDEDLADMAQEWSDGCTWAHGQPDDNPSSFTNIGQNLYYTTGSTITPTASTTSWYDEVSDYTFSSNSCASDAVCGHYTQVVWANSYALGCAITDCSSLSGASFQASSYKYVVCNYGPAGNYVGESPYSEGTTCNACPSGTVCDPDNNDICVDDPKCGTKACNNGGTLDDMSCECDCPTGYNGATCDDGGDDGGDDGDDDNSDGHVNEPTRILGLLTCALTLFTVIYKF